MLTKSVKQHKLFPGVHIFIKVSQGTVKGYKLIFFQRQLNLEEERERQKNTALFIATFVHLENRSKQTTGLSNATPCLGSLLR